MHKESVLSVEVQLQGFQGTTLQKNFYALPRQLTLLVRFLGETPGTQEEGEITLEEQIKMLQEQNLPPEKIAEQILQEDLNADINILSSALNLDKMVLGRIKGRLSRLQKRRGERERGEKEAPPTGEPLYRTEPDTNAILRELLKKHPDIPEKVTEEIMSWAEMSPGGLHPTQVAYLLSSFRGITTQTANIVAQKYSFALQKAQQEGKLPAAMVPAPMGPGPTQPSLFGFGLLPSQTPPFAAGVPSPTAPPAYTPPASGSGWSYPQQPLTLQDVRNLIREEMRPKEATREAELYVEIEEPVKNEQGEVIIDPQDRPIMKKIRVPASQAAQFTPREDIEERVLNRLKAYKELFGSLTEAKVREIVREEAPKSPSTLEEKPLTKEEIERISKESAQGVADAVRQEQDREKKEDDRFKRLEDTIRSTSSARTVEGYKDDGARLLGQGLAEAASVAKEKKPIEVAVRLLTGEGPPSGKEVEPGAGGLFERLVKRGKEKGWVAEQ